jgi:protein-disulfide isomerase
LLAVAGLRGAGSSGAAEALSARVAGYIFASSVVGLSAVLYLGYASLFVLKTYCLFCFITYFAVAGLFLVSGAASDGTMTGLPRRALGDLRALVTSPVALTLALAFGAGAIALVALFPRQVDAVTAAAAAAAPVRTLDATEQSNFDQWYAGLPRVPLAVPTDGAKVLVVKFNDYQCPPCRMTWEQYKPIIAKYIAQYPGKVKYVTKDYPLDGECNVNTPGAGHAAACEAAVAVRLARAKGRAEAMEEWLFANQPQITPDLVRQGARSIGGITDFEEQYAKTIELVKADIAMGASLKVTGTPTFFINGARVPIIKPEFFDAAIAYELKH